MRRRDALQLLAVMVAAPLTAATQTTTKTYRLASFTSGAPVTANSPNGKRLIPTLAQHGYTLGQNLDYHPYGADVQPARLPLVTTFGAAAPAALRYSPQVR